jgi:HEAT repeat protein
MLSLLLLLMAASSAGCRRTPTPTIDPAKMPWIDPKVQIEGLTNRDVRIRGISAFNLGNIGAKAVAALPALEKLAKDDPNPKVRENSQEAIKKIRSASDKAEN